MWTKQDDEHYLVDDNWFTKQMKTFFKIGLRKFSLIHSRSEKLQAF